MPAVASSRKHDTAALYVARGHPCVPHRQGDPSRPGKCAMDSPGRNRIGIWSGFSLPPRSRSRSHSEKGSQTGTGQDGRDTIRLKLVEYAAAAIGGLLVEYCSKMRRDIACGVPWVMGFMVAGYLDVGNCIEFRFVCVPKST